MTAERKVIRAKLGLLELAKPLGKVTPVNVVEIACGSEAATDQAALGGSCRVSLVGVGVSISPMASTPM